MERNTWNKIQTGRVAAAGASPQEDAVAFDTAFADTNYTVVASYTGSDAVADVVVTVKTGTKVAGGFTAITTSPAAGAINGVVEYIAIHD